METFGTVEYIDCRLLAYGVGAAAGEEAASDEFVDPSFAVASEGVGRDESDGMNRRMRLVVVATVAGRFKGAIYETGDISIRPSSGAIRLGSVLLCESTPLLRLSLLLAEGSEIHAAVKLVGFGTRITNESFGIQLLCHLTSQLESL